MQIAKALNPQLVFLETREIPKHGPSPRRQNLRLTAQKPTTISRSRNGAYVNALGATRLDSEGVASCFRHRKTL